MVDITSRMKCSITKGSLCLFRYASTYDQENTRFLKDIKDPHMREATRHRLPSKESLKSAAWPWVAREVPSAPRSVDKIDLTLPPAGATGNGIVVSVTVKHLKIMSFKLLKKKSQNLRYRFTTLK